MRTEASIPQPPSQPIDPVLAYIQDLVERSGVCDYVGVAFSDRALPEILVRSRASQLDIVLRGGRLTPYSIIHQIVEIDKKYMEEQREISIEG